MSTWEERMSAKHPSEDETWLVEARKQNAIDFPYEKAVQSSLDYCSKCAEAKYDAWSNRWESHVTCGLVTVCDCEHHEGEIWLA